LRKSIFVLVVSGLLVLSGLSACGSASGRAKTPKIGVILPDTKSSARWDSEDRKYLQESFESAGIKYDIQNAQGDKAAFQTIADQMLTGGATVLMIVNLDSGTGKAVIDKAKAQGVSVIDYDRLTTNGGASFYVSFDNVAVGKLQGEGLTKCLADKGVKNPLVAELNGSPTDNNASLFKQGYDSVLQPKYDSKAYKKGPDQSVPDWDAGHPGPQAQRPQRQGTRHRSGRDRTGATERVVRRPVHDRLQGGEAGGNGGRPAGRVPRHRPEHPRRPEREGPRIRR
jgi:D-xylose transport system substrate-binding protein